jgi:hypothetical protein
VCPPPIKYDCLSTGHSYLSVHPPIYLSIHPSVVYLYTHTRTHTRARVRWCPESHFMKINIQCCRETLLIALFTTNHQIWWWQLTVEILCCQLLLTKTWMQVKITRVKYFKGNFWSFCVCVCACVFCIYTPITMFT